MTNEYIPEVGPKTVPAHIEEKTITGILNRPAPGTRLRVTLPGTENVLVGTVSNRVSPYALIELEIEGKGFSTFREVTLWIESGWKFEVLPPLRAATTRKRELVDA